MIAGAGWMWYNRSLMSNINLEVFARHWRLTLRGDTDDRYVAGRVHRTLDGVNCTRQLYFDDLELCLLITDGRVVAPRVWKALGARKLWLGDISADSAGRRVQDVRAQGIPMARAPEAIRLVRAFPRRVATEAQRAALAKHAFKAGRGDR
jgi:hypothetical protein